MSTLTKEKIPKTPQDSDYRTELLMIRYEAPRRVSIREGGFKDALEAITWVRENRS